MFKHQEMVAPTAQGTTLRGLQGGKSLDFIYQIPAEIFVRNFKRTALDSRIPTSNNWSALSVYTFTAFPKREKISHGTRCPARTKPRSPTHSFKVGFHFRNPLFVCIGYAFNTNLLDVHFLHVGESLSHFTAPLRR